MEDFAKADCWLGLDAASKIDMTSLAIVFRTADGYALFNRHFMPEETIRLKENRHYQGWEAKGWLTATPGARVSFSMIEDVIKELSQQFNVRSLSYDPKELNDFINRVMVWASFDVVEMQQAPALISEPMKEMEAQVAAGTLRHPSDPVTGWMASNVVKKEARGGGPVKYYYPTKDRPQNKIDGIVAAIMALRQAMLAPAVSLPDVFFM